MSAGIGGQSGPDQDPQLPERGDADTFADMFDAHAAHVFDYCKMLLGTYQEADGATQVTFVTAFSLISYLGEDDRIRAWLFALARRECLRAAPARAELAGLDTVPAAEELRLAERDARAAKRAGIPVRALFDPDQEILDLAYRHDIPSVELPVILGVTPELAADMLAAASARTFEAARGTQASPGLSPMDQVTERQLAAMPDSLRARAIQLASDPDLSSVRQAILAYAGVLDEKGMVVGQPRWREHARSRARRIGLLALPVLAGTLGVLYFGHLALADRAAHAGSPSTVSDASGSAPSTTQASSPPLTGSSQPTPISSLLPGHHAKRGIAPVQPAEPGLPLTSSTPGPTTKPKKPKPKPKPTTKSPTSSGSPWTSPPASPSPTPSPSPSPDPSPDPTTSGASASPGSSSGSPSPS